VNVGVPRVSAGCPGRRGDPRGAEVVGVGVLVDRSAGQARFDGLPLIALWDVATGAPVPGFLVRSTASLDAAEFSPDGRYIATPGTHGHLLIWANEPGRAELVCQLNAVNCYPNLLAFSPADGRLVGANATGFVLWHNPIDTRPTLGPPYQATTRGPGPTRAASRRASAGATPRTVSVSGPTATRTPPPPSPPLPVSAPRRLRFTTQQRPPTPWPQRRSVRSGPGTSSGADPGENGGFAARFTSRRLAEITESQVHEILGAVIEADQDRVPAFTWLGSGVDDRD